MSIYIANPAGQVDGIPIPSTRTRTATNASRRGPESTPCPHAHACPRRPGQPAPCAGDISHLIQRLLRGLAVHIHRHGLLLGRPPPIHPTGTRADAHRACVAAHRPGRLHPEHPREVVASRLVTPPEVREHPAKVRGVDDQLPEGVDAPDEGEDLAYLPVTATAARSPFFQAIGNRHDIDINIYPSLTGRMPDRQESASVALPQLSWWSGIHTRCG